MRVCSAFFVQIIVLAASVIASAAVVPSKWTDRKEYDLVLNIRSESSPQKRLDLLDAWTKAYPQTPLRADRLELYLATYESINDSSRMFDTARQILADNPDSSVGLYWTAVLLPQLQAPTKDDMDLGVKSAKRILAGLNSYFSAERMPASVKKNEWDQQKSAVEVVAHRTLGWASWQTGDFASAEQEFTTCLQTEAQNKEISAWLGVVLALENGKQVPALWHLARASRLDQGATFPEDQRKQVNTLFEHVYASYHGSNDGIDDLRGASGATAFPPSQFSIDSATTMAARQAEAELASTNPELAAWMTLRRELDAPGGEQYFEANLQSKPLPRLKGTILRSTFSHAAREYAVAIGEPGSTAEVVLSLKSDPIRPVRVGSKIAFRGTAESFARDPFSIHVAANPVDVEIVSGK